MVPDRVRPAPLAKAIDVKKKKAQLCRSMIHVNETVALCFIVSHNNLQ